jgi:adenylate cyclase
VNVAARLETLTKAFAPNALFSGTFVTMAGSAQGLERLGAFPLRGVGEPVEVFALADEV